MPIGGVPLPWDIPLLSVLGCVESSLASVQVYTALSTVPSALSAVCQMFSEEKSIPSLTQALPLCSVHSSDHDNRWETKEEAVSSAPESSQSMSLEETPTQVRQRGYKTGCVYGGVCGGDRFQAFP